MKQAVLSAYIGRAIIKMSTDGKEIMAALHTREMRNKQRWLSIPQRKKLEKNQERECPGSCVRICLNSRGLIV